MSDENEEIQGPPLAPDDAAGTPVLRADATDDEEHRPDEPESPPEAPESPTEGDDTQEAPSQLVCPVCGMTPCGHNLPYTPKR